MRTDLGPSGNGSLLGTRYSIVREIARGGMSTVYLANQTPLGRKVALKVLSIPPGTEDLDGLIQRFRLEAQALAQLTHPNIVVVHDYGETEDGRFFLAMEHLDGISLGELFRHGPISVDRALTLLLQVCVGLRYAHKRGVIHRDLKPSNVMIVVDDDGKERVKIVDFGLVKLMESESSLTNPGIVLGSPQFMAPEQIRGDDIDLRADIYSFGVMLFRAVAGQYPFPAADSQTVLAAHLVRPAPKLRESAPHMVFPNALEEVVSRCLQKSPFDRYSSMREVIEALSPMLGGEAKWIRTTTLSKPSLNLPNDRRSSGTTSQVALWGILGVGTMAGGFLSVVVLVLLLYVGWTVSRESQEPIGAIVPNRSSVSPHAEQGAGVADGQAKAPAEGQTEESSTSADPSAGAGLAKRPEGSDGSAPQSPTPHTAREGQGSNHAAAPAPRAPGGTAGPAPREPSRTAVPTAAPVAAPVVGAAGGLVIPALPTSPPTAPVAPKPSLVSPVPVGYFGVPDDLMAPE